MRALGSLVLLVALAGAEEPAPRLRLVPLIDGFRSIAPSDDLGRLPETETFKIALKAGVDLGKPPHPIVACRWTGDRLYYLFYKTTENALGDRPYLIQRIRKTERAWKTPDAPPEEKVTWQVEVFKIRGGELKNPDEHFGSFGLGGNHRREILKEYEIGFGEIAGVCEGRDWPFEPGKLFRLLQAYQADEGIFGKVRFRAATKWTLAVTFDASGAFSVRSAELDFDAPKRLPTPEQTLPPADADSKKVLLVEGKGVEGIAVGETEREQLVRVLGEPIEDAPAGMNNTNLSFRGCLTANLDATGKLNTVFTRAGFAGKTAKGATHGMKREEIVRLYGKAGAPDAEMWRYDGVQFAFDGFDRVKRIVILRK